MKEKHENIAVSASTTTFLTSNYFVIRPGLLVFSNFTSRITSVYSDPIIYRGLDGVESFDLTNDSSDKVIFARSEMGGEESVRKHAFTPDQVAALIDLQPEGVAGKLLTNGFANLFYVVGKDGSLFVVLVDWSAGDCGWGVYAWRLGELADWCAGNRVFCNTQV